MIILLRLITILFFCYVAYCIAFLVMQRQVIYPRHLIASLPEGQKRADVEVIWLETSYGKVEAWFLKAAGKRGEAAPVVIFAHGNAELIDYWPDQLARFTELGVGVLLVEYPGYGRSAGTPSQKSITEASVAAYDMLVTRDEVDPHQIMLLGRSLGGGAVSALAAERPTKALILMSTFTSVRSFAKEFYVPAFLMLDPFDNLSVVATYTAPILIMHGRQDEVIPYQHAQTLYQAAKQGKLLTYDCGHNDCPPDWDVFWQEIELFLREVG
jgi:pimeloyl-ACP methyl ester carboxylesterase